MTAHDAHALRAFDVNALDYLLKPVAPARPAATIARLRRTPAATARRAGWSMATSCSCRWTVDRAFSGSTRSWSVAASGDATTVTTADGVRGRVPRSLRSWEERLPPKQFVRIHREALVNLQFVERIEEWSHEAFQVHIRGLAEPLTLSRRYAARLRARFS